MITSSEVGENRDIDWGIVIKDNAKISVLPNKTGLIASQCLKVETPRYTPARKSYPNQTAFPQGSSPC